MNPSVTTPMEVATFGAFNWGPVLEGLDCTVSQVDDSTSAEGEEVLRRASILIGDKNREIQIGLHEFGLLVRPAFVQQPCVGVDNVDLKVAAQLGVVVANVRGANVDAVADWVLMALLVAERHGVDADHAVRSGDWHAHSADTGTFAKQFRGRDLAALKVGIVGMGAIGRGVVKRLLGFGTSVGFSDPFVKVQEGCAAMELDALLSWADAVTVHVPLEAATFHLLDRDRLKSLRQGAVLVNSSRGSIIDQEALVELVDQGHFRSVALDVYEEEPLPPASPLMRMGNVYLSPHVAGETHTADNNIMTIVRANCEKFITGQQVTHVVTG
jgi:phosphoglycerate dehydrogenase-like enzyme